MYKIIFGLIFLISASAFADGFSHLNMRIELSGYGKRPIGVLLHTTVQEIKNSDCEENGWTGEYKCSVPLSVATTTENLFFLVRPNLLTNSIDAKVLLACNDESEAEVSTLHKSDKNDLSLSGYVNISDAFNFCSSIDKSFRQ